MPNAGTVALIMTLFLALTLGITGILHPPLPPPNPGSEPVVVVLDAGQGGRDPGAVVAGVHEKDVNLAIVLRVQALAKRVPGLKVVLTRSTDQFVELRTRAAKPCTVGAVLYLSVHANSAPSVQACGVETLVDTTRPANDPSFALAAAVQGAVTRATGAKCRGVRRQVLYTRWVRVPAALVEVGFLTCARERALLTTAAYQERVAQGILDGILAFLASP
jgi:N-acetylmuramoyl-L-alanine amidase